MRQTQKLVALSVMALSAGTSVQAQDSLRTTNLEEMVITANRIETPLQDIDRSVNVISSEQIRLSPYQNVAELISAYSTGLYVVGQQQNPGANQSLFIRGTNSNQVNVLIDGVRLTDPSTPGASLDLSELSLLNVERIEILKGSHGTMYGSSGVGGVINIITKRSKTKGFHANGDVQSGTFGRGTSSFKERLELGYMLENGLSFGAGIENWNVNGLDATVDTVTSDAFNPRDKDGFQKLDYFGRLGYTAKNDRASIFYKKTDQSADLDRGPFNDDDNYSSDFNRDFISYNWRHQFNGLSLEFNGGYTQMRRSAVNDSSIVDTDGNYDGQYLYTLNKGQSMTNEIQANWSVGNLDLLAGVGFAKDWMDSKLYSYHWLFGGYDNSLEDLDIKQKYAFIRPSWSVGKFRMSAGSRLTDHQLYGLQSSFDFSPAYAFSTTGRVFLSFSTGFNNPSLYQLFDPQYGNETLSPEKSTSYELGFTKKINNELSLTTSLFKNSIRDVIEYVYVWNGTTPVEDLSYLDDLGSTYLNLSELSSQGMEIEINYVSDRTEINFGYTYMTGDYSYSASDLDQNVVGDNQVQIYANGAFLSSDSESELVRRPGDMLKFSTKYLITSKWSLGMKYTYLGARRDVYYDNTLGPYGATSTSLVGDYALLDVHTSYSINDQFSAVLRAENLLDKNYQEILGYTTRGRGIYLKLNFALGNK